MKIYTLGPDKSFSSMAASKFCIENGIDESSIVLGSSFAEIWAKLSKNVDSFAILPIENTSSSSVHENIDAIFDDVGIKIFAEFFLKIEMVLMGIDGSRRDDIKTLYSHPMVFAQCKRFLSDFSGNTVVSASTSKAVEIVRERGDGTVGVIAGKHLFSDVFTVLDDDVADQKDNFTRFVLVGRGDGSSLLPKFLFENPNKATLIFETKHEPGALAKILTTISLLNGNLLKIESRPIPDSPHRYSFWIDVDLNGTPDNLFEILENNLNALRIVGVYRAGV